MKTEYEAKFIRINQDEIRQRLKDIGATLHRPMRLMRRAIIENEELKKNNAYLGVWYEGDKVALTYKQFNNLSVDGAKEHEIIINDFNEAVSLLAAVGLPDMMIPRQFKQFYRQDPDSARLELAKVTAKSHLRWDFTDKDFGTRTC